VYSYEAVDSQVFPSPNTQNQNLNPKRENLKKRGKMDVQPGSASASNLKIDQSESRKLSVFSNLTRKQSTAIGAKKKRVIKGEFINSL